MRKVLHSSFNLLLFILLFSACDKNSTNINSSTPSCTIISPTNDTSISQGSMILIEVSASSDFAQINEVAFFIDGNEVANLSIPPYAYEWQTLNEAISSHQIVCVAEDINGETASDEISINIILDTVFIDSRDNQSYPIVYIGNQIWLGKNLNYISAYSIFCEGGIPVDDLGRKYKFVDAQAACPDGWHIPSDNEWKELEIYLGMDPSDADSNDWRGTDQGIKLKIETGWLNEENTNSSGFSAQPAGYYWPTIMMCQDIGLGAAWWSSTSDNSDDTYAYLRWLYFGEDGVYRATCPKEQSKSVRCIKD